MKLEDLLGTAYRDDMTLEEVETALAGKKDLSLATEPVVKKDVFDKTASELAKLKKELKALQETSMTDSEKLQVELDKAKSDQLKYNQELAKLRAKEVFVTAGLSEDEFNPILEAILSDDEGVTRGRAENMVKVINAQKEAVDRAVRKELLDSTPPPRAGEQVDLKARYQQEIQAAQESGDLTTMASLIRQQAMDNKL